MEFGSGSLMPISLSPDASARPALSACFVLQPFVYQFYMPLYLNEYFEHWKREIWFEANFVLNNTTRLPLAHKSH